MPSSIGHALAAVALGGAFAPSNATRRFWIAGALCAVLPDIDAVGRPFGRGDLALLGGHRALTHSLLFAVVLSFAVTWMLFRGDGWGGYRLRVGVLLFLATISHGVLDAFASYGEGVGFFQPFTAIRYASPWRPLTPLNEVWFIWLPAVLVLALAWFRRRSTLAEV
jgi:inner membrane protein